MPRCSNSHATLTEPAEWVRHYSGIICRGGTVLDLACGAGRHTRMLLERGKIVTALDRDTSQIVDLSETRNLKIVEHDLEGSAAWPFGSRVFDGIVVVNYLFRPLFPMIIDALAGNGVLIYQTFAIGNEKYGHPRNPNYLLAKNELLDAFGKELNVVKFNQGYIGRPSPAIVQRICCINSH